MSNVFNVNSGQECQIHVELISMSITDFTYSQVGLTRPRSWSRHVLTQLPICCQHHLVCLFVWCCINALYGSVGHTGSKTKQSICFFFCQFVFCFVFHCLQLLWRYLSQIYSLILSAVLIDGYGGGLRQKSDTCFCFVHIEAFPSHSLSDEVCVSQWVFAVCFDKNMKPAVHILSLCVIIFIIKFQINLYLFRKTGWDPWANTAEERLLLQSVS